MGSGMSSATNVCKKSTNKICAVTPILFFKLRGAERLADDKK